MKNLSEIIASARGDQEVDLLIKNGNLVNVYSGEIYQTDIAIDGEYIVGIGGNYRAKDVLDINGLYITPGFIDSHVHIESSMVEVPQFARAVVPLGTTSVIADPHEIANVFGYEGIRYMMDASKYNPLNVYFMMPSCVPSTPMETAGSELRAFDIFPFLREKWVLGLGEVMNFPGVLNGDKDILDKIKISSDKRIDGHAPGLSGMDLNAYVAAGIESDHECTTIEEALEKLRLGMYIMIREGTGTKNLRDLLPMVNCENLRRCMFATDDRHPHDILHEGHIDFMIRTAIKSGVDPVSAIRMGTLNSADYFGLRHLGGIAPGKQADMAIVDDLTNFNVKKVLKNGKLVAENGVATYQLTERPPASIRGSVNIKWLEGDEFKIPVQGRQCHVIGLVKDQIVTEKLVEEPFIKDGYVESDIKRDILRCYVIERHHGSGRIGYGLVKGFGLRSGAIATTISHDSHNIVAVGVSDEDIFNAVKKLNKMGGGIAVSHDNESIRTLELPIGGLMTGLPLEKVNTQLVDLIDYAHFLGSNLSDPFMQLSFIALPVIPKLKLTDKGLVDVQQFKFISLFVD
ncbi:adenine deaminase [candidate division KSB1 bacterium]|nr:adenine deaminase [candidate division KSB1 bacterium]